MKCNCPEGWPQSKERDFDSRADFIARLNEIPPPRFGVTAHRHPCNLSDAPHTIPDDYAHPNFIMGDAVKARRVKNPSVVYSVRLPAKALGAIQREADARGILTSQLVRERVLGKEGNAG